MQQQEEEKLRLAEAKKERRMSWLTVLTGLVIVLIVLAVLKVSITTIAIIAFIILFVAVVLDIIQKDAQRREADRRSEKLNKFINRQL
jgi:Ca2+/Na+ antiporter